MLLQDKILIVLNGGGSRTNSEIASFLTANKMSVRTANTLNVQRGYVTYKRAPKGEAQMSITSFGTEHVQKTLSSSYVAPPKPTPVRDAILEALKKGLWAKDWTKVCRSRSVLYKWIIKLQHEGYKIKKTKIGSAVCYKLLK
jgi:hypothetical protein